MAKIDRTNKNQNQLEKNQNHLEILDFSAKWCGPCQMLKPIIEKLEKKFPNVKFRKIDVDKESEFAEKYDVMSIPTIIFLKNGKVIDTAIGLIAEEQLEEKIKELEKKY